MKDSVNVKTIVSDAGKVVVGFENWEDARVFAKEKGGELVIIREDNGKWKYVGGAQGPFKVKDLVAEKPDSGKMVFDGVEDWIQYYEEEKKMLREDMDDAEFVKYCKEREDMSDRISKMSDEDIAILTDDVLEIVPAEMMDHD